LNQGAAAPVAAAPAVPKPGEQHVAPPKYILFRFLDFNVQPGKIYRYQVKLILKNPNYQLDPAHLEKPALAQGETRESSWSQPSPPVSYPYLEKYIAGGSPTNLAPDGEPEVTVGTKLWFPQFAADGYVKFTDLYRGAMLNSPNVNVVFRKPGEGTGDKVPTRFESNAMLLDFSWERSDRKFQPTGGARINRPIEALIMNARGEIMVRTQTKDLPVWDEEKAASTGAPPPPGAEGPAAATPASPLQFLAPGATPAATPAASPSGSAPRLRLQ
jgi:hypothetical protein